MEITRLVAMANRIGEFFEALPDAQEGMRGVVDHIRGTWEARMRLQLAESLDSSDIGEIGLSSFVETALRNQPERWRVPPRPAEVSRLP